MNPFSPNTPVICDNADCINEGRQKCSGCKLVSYCSKDCQRKHWRSGGHRLNCRSRKEPLRPWIPKPAEGIRNYAHAVLQQKVDASLIKPAHAILSALTRPQSYALYLAVIIHVDDERSTFSLQYLEATITQLSNLTGSAKKDYFRWFGNHPLLGKKPLVLLNAKVALPTTAAGTTTHTYASVHPTDESVTYSLIRGQDFNLERFVIDLMARDHPFPNPPVTTTAVKVDFLPNSDYSVTAILDDGSQFKAFASTQDHWKRL